MATFIKSTSMKYDPNKAGIIKPLARVDVYQVMVTREGRIVFVWRSACPWHDVSTGKGLQAYHQWREYLSHTGVAPVAHGCSPTKFQCGQILGQQDPDAYRVLAELLASRGEFAPSDDVMREIEECIE